MTENLFVMELFARDRSTESLLSRRTVMPTWNNIDSALENAFKHGGSARIEVLKPEDLYVNQVSMTSLPGQFRIIVLTRDEDPKNELLEWWEPGEAGFRGMIRFGDDDWDARTVCHDLSVAQKIFYDLYENGCLSHELMRDLRSQWNPKPK